jgi:alpha-D-xyloside xylohydrolase
VITAGQTSRSVLFPAGDWYDWFTGERYTPGSHTVAAPLETLPLYIRGGGIVPMLRDTIDTLAPATTSGIESYADDPGSLVVRVAPGDASLVMFDNSRIEVTGNRVVFTPGNTFDQGVMFEMIARTSSGAPTSITDDVLGTVTPRTSLAQLQGASEGWFFDPAATGGTLWIKTPGYAGLAIQ